MAMYGNPKLVKIEKMDTWKLWEIYHGTTILDTLFSIFFGVDIDVFEGFRYSPKCMGLRSSNVSCSQYVPGPGIGQRGSTTVPHSTPVF